VGQIAFGAALIAKSIALARTGVALGGLAAMIGVVSGVIGAQHHVRVSWRHLGGGVTTWHPNPAVGPRTWP